MRADLVAIVGSITTGLSGIVSAVLVALTARRRTHGAPGRGGLPRLAPEDILCKAEIPRPSDRRNAP
ncbi:hypothetical protein BLA24_26270 [Streptomyces cinnamoneus]|uniref:Uncharacterized protein n=1 Tax=Streptomyces cinnamoneus TaxID=53446 RepID=A0A2G1XE78_STRCJ|nr:hypothetical protein [Streptomyces cinnamoneus]PHQ49537.1 hypothetical protein BLA24_26270 [Streptomyces cinnamoneus]PPT14743.1 hypothetical protein CYQ11_19370 [Streptomyces cinnamoneus]